MINPRIYEFSNEKYCVKWWILIVHWEKISSIQNDSPAKQRESICSEQWYLFVHTYIYNNIYSYDYVSESSRIIFFHHYSNIWKIQKYNIRFCVLRFCIFLSESFLQMWSWYLRVWHCVHKLLRIPSFNVTALSYISKNWELHRWYQIHWSAASWDSNSWDSLYS